MGQRTHVHLPRMLPGAGSRSPLTCLDQGAPWMPRPGFRKPRDKAARLRNAGTYHPYPQGLFQAATWNDSRPSFSFDSPSITPKNIEVLDAYLHRPLSFIKGKNSGRFCFPNRAFTPRTIPPRPSNFRRWRWSTRGTRSGRSRPLKPSTTTGGSTPGRRAVSCLACALWETPRPPMASASSAWSVYQALDTPGEQDASAFAKELIGVTDFSQIPYRGPIPDRAEGR